MEKVARVLNIPVETIKNFKDAVVVNVISNTFNDTFYDNASFVIDHQSNVHHNDKLVETLERLLKAEQESNALLKKIVAGLRNEPD